MAYSERSAMEAGYQYTGHYSWRHEEMKEAAAKLRKEGNKATVVWVPGSKLSRSGSGGGWSVYWVESEANKSVREAKSRENQIRYMHKEREDYRAKIAELDEKIAKLMEGK